MKALGNFRGTIVDSGVSATSGGFPQLVLKVHADEMYDEEEKKWFPWDDFDWDAAEAKDRSIVSYNVLFGAKGATLSCDQVKKITGWEGDSFATLCAMDLTGMKIQWRNEEDTYDGKTKVQVSWIDLFDAEPGGTVRKLDDSALKALDAKFGEFLTSTVKPETATGGRKRGSKKPAADAPAEETKTEAPAEETKTEKPKGRRGRPKGKDKAAEAPKTEAPKTEPPEASKTEPPESPESKSEEDVLATSGPCTKQEAWADVNELKSEGVTDTELSAEWLKQIDAMAPGKEQKDITDEEWGTVRAAVLDVTATF
jgi:hypothetical protein